MNKTAYIKLVFAFLATIIFFIFLTNSNSGIPNFFNPVIILDFILAFTIFMYINKNGHIFKNKFICNVILMLLIVISFVYASYWLFSHIFCYIGPDCGFEKLTIYIELLPTLLFLNLFLSFKDIFSKTNKVNDWLIIVISLLMIFVHVRYYFDDNILNKIVNSNYATEISEKFVFQNYGYYTFLLFISFIHRYINSTN